MTRPNYGIKFVAIFSFLFESECFSICGLVLYWQTSQVVYPTLFYWQLGVEQFCEELFSHSLGPRRDGHVYK